MEDKAATFADFKTFTQVEDTEHGGFEGYGAVYGNRDLGGDVMIPGSVKNVDALTREGFIGLNHDWDALPIGVITDARQDEHGLWIKTAYHSHPQAQAARAVATERLAAGKSVGLSIGYTVLPNGWTARDDATRELHAVEVHEVSQVNVPMNPRAQVSDAKDLTREELELNADGAVSALNAYVSRLAGYSAARVKEGRVLSAANRSRLQTLLTALNDVRGDIEKLLRETEPEKSRDEARALVAEWIALSAQVEGLTHHAYV